MPDDDTPKKDTVAVTELKEERTAEATPAIPGELPILPLRGMVVYPLMVLPLTIGQVRSMRLVDSVVVSEQRMVGLFASQKPEEDEPGPDIINTVGTAAVIHRLIKAPDGTMRIIVQGIDRIRIKEWLDKEPFLRASIDISPDIMPEEGSLEVEALMRNVVDLFRRLVELVPHLPDELMMAAANTDDPRQLVYLIATSIRMSVEDAQSILSLNKVTEKLRKLTTLLTRELEVLELGKKIQTEAQGEMEKMQREYFLREQLKAIQRELGEGDEQQVEVEEFRKKIEANGLPEEAKKEALRELSRLEKLHPSAAEYGVIRTYLDWLTGLPWQVSTDDNLDISRARQVLDEDHYDLKEIKERILEFLSVRKLRTERSAAKEGAEADETKAAIDYIRKEREGVILCFVGPPGVGKTSLGQSIARALGRKFIRMSLGGIHDEAEIRGHRRTYIGAMPGQIIQAIQRIGSHNPVMMLDEVDKVGADWRGDPSSALLEVLDPEQNRDFRDNYLDVGFDLSQVMFITTANVLDTIPAPLRDRMEILQLSGYTEDEKLHIAERYLIPRQIKENALKEQEVKIEQKAVAKIIRDYTREAGVRSLEREIGRICRKLATRIAEGSETIADVEEKDIVEYLGKPKYFYEAAARTVIPGVATGLAWTPTGGDILFVEASRMPGHKGFTITGQLGDVMKESAQAALTYIRSQAKRFSIPEDFFEHSDLHVHVPAGAIPKDGPSAGVTMATALASLLEGRPTKEDVCMTGEITLRGQVLPVGGIKEKVLAAHRAGLKTVILPRRNEADLEELPDEIREKMNFILVDNIDEAIDHALADKIELPEGPADDGQEELKNQSEEEK